MAAAVDPGHIATAAVVAYDVVVSTAVGVFVAAPPELLGLLLGVDELLLLQSLSFVGQRLYLCTAHIQP